VKKLDVKIKMAGGDTTYSRPVSNGGHVPHSPQEKKLVLTRVRRLRGQVDALERALEAGAECASVMQQIAAARGAVNGLMAEMLESHLRDEFSNATNFNDGTNASINGVINLVRTYLR
jgi:DNA-binding FrmR family transcriptional regulator